MELKTKGLSISYTKIQKNIKKSQRYSSKLNYY